MLSQIFDPSIKFQIVPVFQQAIISVHHCSSGNTIKGLTFTAPIDVASCLFQQLSFTRFDPVHAHIGVYQVQFRLRLTLNIKKLKIYDWFKKFNQGCMWARISLTWRRYLVQYCCWHVGSCSVPDSSLCDARAAWCPHCGPSNLMEVDHEQQQQSGQSSTSIANILLYLKQLSQWNKSLIKHHKSSHSFSQIKSV